MEPEFVTFQKFGEKEKAEELIAFLSKHQIESQLQDNSSPLDASFGGSGFTDDFSVKLQQADFEKANRLLIEDSISDLSAIDKDYYLFSFSDDELRDVIAHRDQWNAFDFLLAQKLLKERGHEIDEAELEAIKQERLAELSRPEPRQTTAIVFGYITAVLGGWLGMVIGWFLSTHKKTLPNGERVYNYTEADRRQGKRILYLGIFFAVFWKLVWIFRWHETFQS